MTHPAPSIPENEVERLLVSLAGILSARVIAGPDGTPEEIHILAAPGLPPKQVVRNVESALTAGLGIEIDRRRISVAQVRADPPPPPTPSPATPPPPPRAPTADTPGRLRLAGYETRSLISRQTTCRVTLARETAEYTGTGEGPDTPQGRTEAAARATFAALAAALGPEAPGLEGATLVEAHGRRYALVAARTTPRLPAHVAGAAPVERSTEEAAILAALQAANRALETSATKGRTPWTHP